MYTRKTETKLYDGNTDPFKEYRLLKPLWRPQCFASVCFVLFCILFVWFCFDSIDEEMTNLTHWSNQVSHVYFRRHLAQDYVLNFWPCEFLNFLQPSAPRRKLKHLHWINIIFIHRHINMNFLCLEYSLSHDVGVVVLFHFFPWRFHIIHFIYSRLSTVFSLMSFCKRKIFFSMSKTQKRKHLVSSM